MSRVAAAPSTATGPTLWADCSNYSGSLTDQGCADLKAAGVVGIIVQAVTGLDGKTYTRQQLDAAVRNGLRIQGYVFCQHAQSVASRLPMFNGFLVETIWLDVEMTGLTLKNVDRDLALIDAYLGTGHLAGIYTGRWYAVQQGWLKVTKWADAGRALWASIYDDIPDVDVGFVPFCGWVVCQAKQFKGTSAIGSVQEIDLSVMTIDSWREPERNR